MLSAAPVVVSYLIGAIPCGLLVSRVFGVRDIRTVGSGNIGASNVWRVVGFKAAVWVYVGDIAKGAVAVMIARYVSANFEVALLSRDVFLVTCALAAVLGHVFPVYIGFRGGKGVNTALGAVLTLLPVEALLSFAVFVLVVTLFRYVSLGSMVGAASLFLIVSVEKYLLRMAVADVYFYLSLVLALLIVVTHYQNISRLIAGTESRFSFSSRSNKAGSDV